MVYSIHKLESKVKGFKFQRNSNDKSGIPCLIYLTCWVFVFINYLFIVMLNERRAGIPVIDLCRKYNIASSTYYKFKAKYDGMNIAEIKKLKSLAKENNRLKQMYADIILEHKILKEVLEKKFPGLIDDK